jgi:hypothetical protein
MSGFGHDVNVVVRPCVDGSLSARVLLNFLQRWSVRLCSAFCCGA